MRISKLMTMRWLRAKDAGVLCFCLLLPICIQPALAQHSTGLGTNPLATSGQFGVGSLDQPPNLATGPLDRKMREKQVDALNTLRQKALVSDTDKLVKLAAVLNAQINSSHQAQLTPDQLRTVAEIERLAKRIREKMSDAGSGAPSVIRQPPILLPAAPVVP